MTTGIVIVDHGSRRAESNRMLEEVARQFAARFAATYSVVEPAHMELAEPSIETAYGKCVARGATHIICLPYFLAEGKHWTRDIPSLLAQAAVAFPGTSYRLIEPLGIDDLLLDLLMKRAEHSTQPTIRSGESDPRVEGLEPTTRREQCTSCPFRIEPDGSITDTRQLGRAAG